MKKEEFTEFVENGVSYITTFFSETEATKYKKNMFVLYEKGDFNDILNYLALNYFTQYGKRSEFFHRILKNFLSIVGVDIKTFLHDFNIDLYKGLRLQNLSNYYYEATSGNVVSKKYVYDNINLLMEHLDFYRVHNCIFIDGDPVFIPTTNNISIFEYVKFLLDLNSLFEYYTPDELAEVQEKLNTVLEQNLLFSKQELKEKITNLDIKNRSLVAEILLLLQ